MDATFKRAEWCIAFDNAALWECKLATQFYLVGAYLFGLILTLVTRGDLAPRSFPSGLLSTLVSVVLLVFCFVFGRTAAYGAAGVLFLVLLLAVPLFAFGLGSLTAALLGLVRNCKTLFYPALVLFISLPIGWASWVHFDLWQLNLERQKRVLAFQDAMVEASFGGRKVSLPAHPKIQIRYACVLREGRRQSECSAFFGNKSVLEIESRIPPSSGLEILQIRLRKPSRIDTCRKDAVKACAPETDPDGWCLRQQDLRAKALCKAMPAHDLTFETSQDGLIDYHKRRGMVTVEMTGHIPSQDEDLLDLVCKDDAGAATCRSSYKVTNDLFATISFHRIPHAQVHSVVAETLQKTKRIWQLITDGVQ